MVVAERIRAAICRADGPAASVTVSVGVATVHGATDRRSLIAMADRALYQAKAAGRNRVALAVDIVETEAARERV